MIGKVIKYNDFSERGIIYSFSNRKTYLFKKSNAIDGDVGYGYIVDFYGYYDEESSRRCAKNISVIECIDSNSKQPITKKKKKRSKRKPINASRYGYHNSKKFQKFIKDFMREQRNNKKEKSGCNSNI